MEGETIYGMVFHGVNFCQILYILYLKLKSFSHFGGIETKNVIHVEERAKNVYEDREHVKKYILVPYSHNIFFK